MIRKLSLLLVCHVAACASRPRCVPDDGPRLSNEKAQIKVSATQDTGVVRIHVASDVGRPLPQGASVSVTPDSGLSRASYDTQTVFRMSRPFRLFVRSVGHRPADTVITPRLDGGTEIYVALPSLYAATPPLCVER